MNPFMQAAIETAREGIRNGHGGPFGCVIVKDGRIIASGHNEVLLQHDPTCHGEMVTIRRACAALDSFDLEGCELYTTGEPCPMCMGAIMWANISRVYYGCNINDTDRIGFRDEKFYSTDRSSLMTCIDREECLRLYDEYNEMENKKLY